MYLIYSLSIKNAGDEDYLHFTATYVQINETCHRKLQTDTKSNYLFGENDCILLY